MIHFSLAITVINSVKISGLCNQLSSNNRGFPICSQILCTHFCGGAVVYWIEPLTLNQRVAGSNPDRDRELRTFVLQQDNSSTLLLSTQE